MAVYTSYYSNRAVPEDAVRIGISVTSPPWVHLDEKIPVLYPEPSTLWGYKNGTVSKERYIEDYYLKLDRNRPQVESALRRLESRYAGKDVVLLCWCGPKNFCHRKLLADYARRNLGMDIREY